MSRRRSTEGRGDVSGPTSALTSFLREKGIAVPRGNRFARAEQTPTTPAEADPDPNEDATVPLPDLANLPPTPEAGPSSAPSSSKKRKADSSKAETSAKKTTAAQKKAAKKQATLDAELAELGQVYNPPKGRYSDRTPGASVYCEDCGVKFTLTRYTPSSADGKGVLCTKCQEENDVPDDLGQAVKEKEKKKGRAVRAKPTPVEKPAKIVPTLQHACIGLIGKHIDSVEELGEVGSGNMDKICQIVCKNRGLSDGTIKLFLDLHSQQLTLYDCAQLNTDAYDQITSFAPRIKHLTLNFAGGLNDEGLDVLGKKLKHLVRIELYGPYLVRVAQWDKFLDTFLDDGREPLSGFLVRQSPRLSNQNITKLVENFPNLTELRLSQIQKLDNSSLDLLHSLKSLTLLDISSAGLTGENLTDEGVIPLIKAVGGKLETLNLSSNQNLTDGCLTQGIKSACPNLRVLGLSELDLTPTGVKDLFSSWFENTGLEKLDLKGCLDLDDEAIQAVVAHSGRELRDLDLHSVDAKLTEVGLKAVASGCPELRKLDLGFVRALDDFILKEILDNCPMLDKLSIFGCSRLTDSAPLRNGVIGIHMKVE